MTTLFGPPRPAVLARRRAASGARFTRPLGRVRTKSVPRMRAPVVGEYRDGSRCGRTRVNGEFAAARELTRLEHLVSALGVQPVLGEFSHLVRCRR